MLITYTKDDHCFQSCLTSEMEKICIGLTVLVDIWEALTQTLIKADVNTSNNGMKECSEKREREQSNEERCHGTILFGRWFFESFEIGKK